MAPSDPSDTVLAVCLRVRQSGALRVFVALRRIILDLWAAPPQCGYRGSMGSFCSAPQDFALEFWVVGFFFARAFLLGRLVYLVPGHDNKHDGE